MKRLALFTAALLSLAACSQQATPRADMAAAARYVSDLTPVIVAADPVAPPVTFGAPDPLKCAVLLTTEAGRQVVRLEAGNLNCPPQDSGRAPIWLDFSKDGRLIISYGLWADHGSRASAGPDVTITREDGGPITTH